MLLNKRLFGGENKQEYAFTCLKKEILNKQKMNKAAIKKMFVYPFTYPDF